MSKQASGHTRVITLRLTASQHFGLTKEASAKGISLNTHLLERLGLDVPTSCKGTPRGRRSPVLSQHQPSLDDTLPGDDSSTTDLLAGV